MRTTPENITELQPNEIFVFGSNTAGRHGKGAAKLAREKFGAKNGVGEGLTGECYAFPTLDAPSHGGLYVEKRVRGALIESIRILYETAYNNSHLTFLLTKVGCGLAGYTEPYMISTFNHWLLPERPANIIFPEGW